MDKFGIDLQEFRDVFKACWPIRVERCPPGFDLKRYLVERINKTSPDSARKIEKLPNRQVELLCREIVQQQKGLR